MEESIAECVLASEEGIHFMASGSNALLCCTESTKNTDIKRYA